jgi:hypothetical protein
MLRDELTQKFSHFDKITVLDTPEHVDSENLIKQISFGRSAYQLFSKCDLNS